MILSGTGCRFDKLKALSLSKGESLCQHSCRAVRTAHTLTITPWVTSAAGTRIVPWLNSRSFSAVERLEKISVRLPGACCYKFCTAMSAQEIIAELPALTEADLLLVKTRLEELTERPPVESAWAVLERWSGKAEGLPPDMAENHDHYIHGARKRTP